MSAAAAQSSFVGKAVRSARAQRQTRRQAAVTKAATYNGAYAEELVATAKKITMPGKGLLAMDESNKTCGVRLQSIGVENTEENRIRYRSLLLSTPGLGQWCSGAILFEETLYQQTNLDKSFVELLNEQDIVPGIKVDKGLVNMANANEGEQWCQGLDGLAERCAAFYEQGARFAKWRSTVNIPAGASEKAMNDCAYGLARYAAICQNAGLVPIVEPEILLDGTHDIDRTYEAASKTWALVFKYLADQDVMLEGILLKPSMVTPGAECEKRPDAATIADYTLRLLKNRVPVAVPGIMFLSGGQSEQEATANLNAMNQSPNPWHVSFSYARALQNNVLKTWLGDDANADAAQQALVKRASLNSQAQLGQYSPDTEDPAAFESMFVKNYSY